MENHYEEGEMEETEVEVRLTPADQIQPEDSEEVMRFMELGYGERWQGEDNYRDAILSNATELLRIYVESDLGAALFIDNDRITAIAVHPGMRGKGLGIRLFQEAVKASPNVWISAGIDAEEMMTTLTSSKLSFHPVDDQAEIEALYRKTNQARDNKWKVEVDRRKIQYLVERLISKGIHQDTFTTYVREGGTHKGAYRQVLFQNKPQALAGIAPAK